MDINPQILKGKFFVYRAYDILDEINLDFIETELSNENAPEKFKLRRKTGQALRILSTPLSLSFGKIDLEIGGKIFNVDITAKAWSFGALSFNFQFDIAGIKWIELNNLAISIESDYQIDKLAKEYLSDFCSRFSKARHNLEHWDTFEDYIIFYLEKIEGIEVLAKNILTLPQWSSLVILEQKYQISSRIETLLLNNIFQYSESDLALIDWNSAMVIEPDGDMDVVDIIEFALVQLLEVRYYDDLLDQKLNKLYDGIKKGEGGALRNKFRKLSREAGQYYLEIAEIVETIENSIKVVGDFYLATIFRASTERFRIHDWLKNIEKKLEHLADISKYLQGETHQKVSHFLEIIIIVLITFELLPLLPKLYYFVSQMMK